jgi:hypothetical protein
VSRAIGGTHVAPCVAHDGVVLILGHSSVTAQVLEAVPPRVIRHLAAVFDAEAPDPPPCPFGVGRTEVPERTGAEIGKQAATLGQVPDVGEKSLPDQGGVQRNRPD